ncbi:phosphonate ABC transporter ATP-binding protein [Salinibius halmophilus]|uniref:phosphonate ABC transporter ATP-binding protein n=1 Tax=Salinibius halmophilus TaxID=1853216 RepID=UPI000E672AF2|nr:ATP-binding cassette domain-containing protein [Salinibius halmophilus]
MSAPAAVTTTVTTPATVAVTESVTTAAAAPLVSPALQVQGLSKAFNQQPPVFSNVDLTVAPGQAVAIIGANGAGKSTLLRCCVRLLEPDAGQVSIAGKPFSELHGKALRQARSQVGFVFQKHQLIPRLSVLSNVLHGALGSQGGWRMWRQAWAPSNERDRAYHMLEQVGLAHLALRRADTLSGGQSQRVAIARALMQTPRLLMADEPTASLDPSSGMAVMELLKQVTQSNQIGLLMVSHNLEQTMQYSDQIVGLKQQRIALNSASRECCREQLRAFFSTGATHA